MVQIIQQNLHNLPEYTEAQVRDEAGERCIVIIYDLVYDLTDFLDEHPGGAEVIYEMSGMDVTNVFEDVGHSKIARTLMLQYVIGKLAPNKKHEYLLNATKLISSIWVRQ